MKRNNIKLDANILQAVLDSLDDAKAGQLIKSILAIHSGNDDAIDGLQLDVRMALEMFRKQMTEQREKSSERSRVNAENVRKRWAKKGQPEEPQYIEQPLPEPPAPEPESQPDPEIVIEEVIPLTEEPEQKPKAKCVTHADYDWVAPEMFPIFNEWCEFRRKSGKNFAAEQYVHQNYNKLMKLSGGDPAIAAAIVEQSISNGYQGLFPLKQNNNGLNSKFDRQLADEQQRINAVAADCADRIRRTTSGGVGQERFVPPKL